MTPRHAFIGGRRLVDAVIQIATDVEPWAEKIAVNVFDYVESHWRGASCRVPIPKPIAASAATFARFTHPLSPERLEEMAAEAKASTHVVEVFPDGTIPRGELWVVGSGGK